jgi:tetratricopeptide (TPR) repeat protein
VARQAVELREHRSGATDPEAAPATAPPAEEPAGPPQTPWRRRLEGFGRLRQRLGSIATALDAAIGVVRSLVVSIAMIIGVAVAFGVVVSELRQRLLVLEPIQIPKRLLDLGYTPQTVARQLKEQIRAIQVASTTLKEVQGLQGEWEQLDIQIPETETTLRQVVNQLRGLLDRPETRVGGTIIGADDLGYTLQLWSDGGTLGAIEIDQERVGTPILKHGMPVLIADAAEAIMAHSEPYVLALAWFAEELRAPAVSEERIGRIKGLLHSRWKDVPAADVPWVHNQFGLLSYRTGDLDAALAAYDRALAADPAFAIARYNRGLAHAKKGDFAAAAADYEQALMITGDGAITHARDRFGLAVRRVCARFHLAMADPSEANRSLFTRSQDAVRPYEGGIVPAAWTSSFFGSAPVNCQSDKMERFLAGLA